MTPGHYDKPWVEWLVQIDCHGSKETPTETCHAILRAAGPGK